MESKRFFRGSLDKAHDLFSIPHVFNKRVMFHSSRGFGGAGQQGSELQPGHCGDFISATVSPPKYAALG